MKWMGFAQERVWLCGLTPRATKSCHALFKEGAALARLNRVKR